MATGSCLSQWSPKVGHVSVLCLIFHGNGTQGIQFSGAELEDHRHWNSQPPPSVTGKASGDDGKTTDCGVRHAWLSTLASRPTPCGQDPEPLPALDFSSVELRSQYLPCIWAFRKHMSMMLLLMELLAAPPWTSPEPPSLHLSWFVLTAGLRGLEFQSPVLHFCSPIEISLSLLCGSIYEAFDVVTSKPNVSISRWPQDRLVFGERLVQQVANWVCRPSEGSSLTLAYVDSPLDSGCPIRPSRALWGCCMNEPVWNLSPRVGSLLRGQRNVVTSILLSYLKTYDFFLS